MKKYAIVLFVFVFIAAFTAAPKTVSAFQPVTEPESWEWYTEGVNGEVIPMVKITTTPREWYQLRSNGLKVDGATKICHGFDDGRYGWTGEIFRLVEDTWVKLPTTVGWAPTEEGHYMACTMAPAAGTYALFGYWSIPEGYFKGPPSCASLGLSPDWTVLSTNLTTLPFRIDFFSFNGNWSAFPDTSIQMIIKNANPPVVWNSSATVTTGPTGSFDFGCFPWYYEGPEIDHISFTVRLVTPVCYQDLNYSYVVDP
jgi:hypothetical protein